MGDDRPLASAALIALIGALTVLPLGAQQTATQQPAGATGARDVRFDVRGAAHIRGRVTIDGTAAPVRGAIVRAIPRSAGEVLTTQANEDGWFEFTGLAAGRWTLEAEKGGFLSGRLGPRTTIGPGTTLTISGNESHSVNVPLIKGAVIGGQLLDDTGEPAVAARVEAMRWTIVEGRRTLVSAGADQTDDTGAYRIHSLPPGDYVVLARGGAPGAMSITNVDNSGRSIVMVVDRAGSGAEWFRGRSAAPTYFPGTPTVGDAHRVTLGRGEARLGVTFAMTTAPLVRISGSVVSSSGTPIDGQVTVSLLDATGQAGPAGPGSRRTDGNFELRDVAPGSYVLVAAHGSFPAPQSEFATLPIVVGSEDLTGLTLVTRPGGSLKGTVTGDGNVTPDTSNIGVYARPLQRGAFPMVDIGAPVRDGRFEIANIAATSRLMVERMPAGWMLKSITISGVDVTDTPIEFASGNQVTASIVLTNRLTRLGGVVTAAGRPTEDATVIVFPEDAAKWAYPSRYVGKARPNESGNYVIPELAPFENYLAVAVDAYESTQEQDPEFLEQLRGVATPFSLAAGESKRLNLSVLER